ncbi:unnamed protein product [Ectocarpus sp. 6 AP-2014]
MGEEEEEDGESRVISVDHYECVAPHQSPCRAPADKEIASTPNEGVLEASSVNGQAPKGAHRTPSSLRASPLERSAGILQPREAEARPRTRTAWATLMEGQLRTPGGHHSIVGSWVLDLSRSDTMELFLRIHGMPDKHIREHVSAETVHGGFNVIDLGEDTIIIHKRTCTNCYTERSYTLDEEKVKYNEVTRTRVSEVLSVPCSGPTGFVRSANCSTAGGRDNVHMLETRHVVEGGLAHTQEIRLHNLTTGEDCVTNRVWMRVPMTEEHQAALGPL